MRFLISSNLERLIYHIAGDNAQKDADYMKKLSAEGRYEISDEMRKQLADFYGNFASEEETAAAIRGLYQSTGYVIDTHTAVAASVYQKYEKDTDDDTVTVIASTASPFKFTRAVMNAIGHADETADDFALADQLAQMAGLTVPDAVQSIRSAEIRHKTVCDKREMEHAVKNFLGM